MSYYAIIYMPERETKSPGLPFGNDGDCVFSYIKYAVNAEEGQQAIAVPSMPKKAAKKKEDVAELSPSEVLMAQMMETMQQMQLQMAQQMQQSQQNAAKASKTFQMKQIETDVCILRKGTNFITMAEWDKASRSPNNVKEVNRLADEGIIKVFTPDDVDNAAQDTNDFSDLSIVQQIVEYSTNLEWLEMSMNVDRRIEAKKVLSARLTFLRKQEKIKQQQHRPVLAGMS